MNNQTTAVTILAEATLKAAADIAISQGLYKRGDSEFAERLSETLKTVTKANLDRILAEWENALDANLSNLWLQQLIKVQSIELAKEAIREIS